MLLIKKIFLFFQLFITIYLSFNVSNVLAQDNQSSTQEQLAAKIEQLILLPPENLTYEEVTNLSHQIIPQLSSYSSDTIAKTYLLLVNIALNKGELETAFQFAQDGLAISSPNKQIQLRLQLKLAAVFVKKKQYQKLLNITEQAISNVATEQQGKYHLFALSYRSVAYAMLSQHNKALKELQNIQEIIQQNPTFKEHVELLTILANAYFHLNEYQTALAMQLRILKLRFNHNQLNGVGQTYYFLGKIYFHLQRYNDAYNAYWEAEEYAEKISAPIYRAYAKQGLALTLIKQKHYQRAEKELLAAQQEFLKNNLISSYLETLITFTQISQSMEKIPESYQYLIEAEKASQSTTLNDDYIVFYQLLAQMYFAQHELTQAYKWQQKYSQALESNIAKNTLISTLDNRGMSASTESKELALKLAQQSELTSLFSSKYQNQQLVIFLLALVILAITLIQLFFWLKHRAKKLSVKYNAQEKPLHVLTTPNHTKQQYQTHFNMARKYNYPLTLGYLSITNWHELTFKFDKKTVAEVRLTIIDLISQHLSELESAGLINEGEYLLFFPHQAEKEVSKTVNDIIQALKLRFFANLGDFSVTLAYSIKSPNYQDIDPYIFLSHLTHSSQST